MSNAHASEMQQFGNVWPQCVARAWQDEQFREALKRDPAGTLLAHFQFTVPAGIDLQVADNDDAVVRAQQANTLRLVIPPTPDMEMGGIALVGPDVSTTSARFCFSNPFSMPFCTC